MTLVVITIKQNKMNITLKLFKEVNFYYMPDDEDYAASLLSFGSTLSFPIP